MRLLGTNLLPFSVAQLASGWSTGLEMEAYFFPGDIPDDISQYYLDNRKLIADCVSACRFVLKPTLEGLLLQQQYSFGFKAVSGSVYDPKLGVTKHYPKNILPRGFSASASSVEIESAYASSLELGNKRLKQYLSISLFPGFHIGTTRQLNGYSANGFLAQNAGATDLEFENIIKFDALLCEDAEKTTAATLTLANNSDDTVKTSPAKLVYRSFTCPANISAYASATPVISDKLRVYAASDSLRRGIPVTVGNVATETVTKTIGHAIVIFTDSTHGSLSLGNRDVRMMATKVGVLGSGELIEVESLQLKTGEFAEILQVRTATVTQAMPNLPEEPDFQYPEFEELSNPIANIANLGQDLNTSFAGYFRVNLDAKEPLHTMYGSPYKSYFKYGSWIDRVITHCCPSEDVLNDIWKNSRRVVLRLNQIGKRSTYTGLNRNGYLSTSFSGNSDAMQVSDFIYWDYSLNKMMRCNPSIGSDPIEWDGTFSTEPEPTAYDIFVAASESLVSMPSTEQAGSVPGRYRVDFKSTDVFTYTMYGTSHGEGNTSNGFFSVDSYLAMAILHACPSLEVFNDIVQNNRRVFVYLWGNNSNYGPYLGINRNGYVSKSRAGSSLCTAILKFVYWDYTLGKMMQTIPRTEASAAAIEWDGTF